jgi:peptidoglycan/LPS O-acetylase OafA/YrhL
MWQELFLMRPDAGVFPFGKLSSFPFNLICVFVVSALSYYFIERPGITLGKRLFGAKKSRTVVAVSL